MCQGLEQETGVQVECETAVLLIETLSALECHDDVLVHDEAKAQAGGAVETILAVEYEFVVKPLIYRYLGKAGYRISLDYILFRCLSECHIVSPENMCSISKCAEGECNILLPELEFDEFVPEFDVVETCVKSLNPV